MLNWFVRRLAQTGKRVGREEKGFTLIELLVVVIIIGILAAIAIPVFLNQRANAWDAAAESDVRNMATAQEGYFTQNNSYTTTLSDLEAQGFRPSDSASGHAAPTGSSTTYCVQAQSQSGTRFNMTPTASGSQTGQCY